MARAVKFLLRLIFQLYHVLLYVIIIQVDPPSISPFDLASICPRSALGTLDLPSISLRSRLRSRLDLRVRPYVLTAQAFRSPLDLSKTRVDARVPWGSKLPLLGDALAHDLLWLITEARRLPPTSPRAPPDLALISP